MCFDGGQWRGCQPAQIDSTGYRLVGYGLAGVDPTIMGIRQAYAIRNLLDKVSMSLDQIDLVEVCVCVCLCMYVCVCVYWAS